MSDSSQVSVSGNDLRIDPHKNLLITGQGVPYTITMSAGAIKDTGNNVFPGISGTTYRVTSEPDIVRPNVLTYSPPQGGTEVPQSPNLILIFDESVQAGTGSIVLTPLSGDAISIPVTDKQVSFAAAMVTVNPSVVLSAGMTYSVRMVGDVVQDTYGFNGYSGLGVSGRPSYSFTVSASATAVKVSFKPTADSTYLVDLGMGYTYHNSSVGDYYYGWSCAGTSFDHGTHNQQAWGQYMDRYNNCTGQTCWSIGVANGIYDISVIMPVGNHGSCTIEGTASGGTNETPFTYTANSVEVTDGKVTVAGDFPTCSGMQEIVISVPSGSVDNGCTEKLDGKVCGPIQDLHLAEGECMMLVKPAGSKCSREAGSTSEPLNPVNLYPVPADARLVPMIRL